MLSKQVVIEDPKQFAEYANSILPKIEVVFVVNEMEIYPWDPWGTLC